MQKIINAVSLVSLWNEKNWRHASQLNKHEVHVLFNANTFFCDQFLNSGSLTANAAAWNP